MLPFCLLLLLVRSTSRTAGHTKWLQHIPLDLFGEQQDYYGLEAEAFHAAATCANNVYLIDCPGLVFPSLVPRCIGELLGLYPIGKRWVVVVVCDAISPHAFVVSFFVQPQHKSVNISVRFVMWRNGSMCHNCTT